MSGEIRNSIEELVDLTPESELHVNEPMLSIHKPIIHKTLLHMDGRTDIDDHDSDDLKQKIYTCELCGVKVTSANVLRRHLEGRKHMMRVERDGKTFECQLCEVIANSQSQLDAHLRSLKHKNKLYRKEHAHELVNKGIWIILLCIACIFLNFLLLFKIVL